MAFEKINGIRLVCTSDNINSTLKFDEFDDDIVGPDKLMKASYWIQMTLIDVSQHIDENLYGIVEAWLLMDNSRGFEIAIDHIGRIELFKMYETT